MGSKSQQPARSLWAEMVSVHKAIPGAFGHLPLGQGVSLHCHLLACASGAELTELGVPSRAGGTPGWNKGWSLSGQVAAVPSRGRRRFCVR